MRPQKFKLHILGVLSVLLAATLACSSLAPQTPTPIPSPTPAPTDTPTNTPTPTDAPTSTPVPTRTALPTRTLTPVPQPGDVLLADTFDSADDNHWATWLEIDAKGVVEDGVFLMNVTDRNTVYYTNPSAPTLSKRLQNVDISVEVTLTDGASANTTMGVQCRKRNDDNYYMFAITGDGFYNVSKYVEAEWKDLVPWTLSSAIKTGKATNLLRAVCSEDVLQFWVNGVKLATLRDKEFKQGIIGLAVGTFDDLTADSTVTFDNLNVLLPELIAPVVGDNGTTGTSGGSTPQPTVAAVATQPPAGGGQGTLTVTNNVSFGVLIVVWGPGDFRIDAPPNQTITAQLPTGTYGWQVFANGCELYPTESLVLNPAAQVTVESYTENECGYQVYYGWP